MSIEVKLRRGTTTAHSSFTGALGEITIDTDKNTVVVHDGVTAGGYPLPTSGSAVDSVNGQTGAVVLDYADVGAQPYNANTVIDASYVHTDNNYTTTEKSKLAGIASGAEVNVNADWNAVSGDAQILNKPTLGTAAAQDTSYFATAAQGTKADTAVQPGSLATVATTGLYSDLTGKPTLGTAAAAATTDFATAAQGTKADSAVQPAAIANMLETADIGVSVQAYNANTVVDASYVHTDNNYTSTEKTKLAGIQAGAEVNVNADWNAVSGDAQILNKPSLATVATTGAYSDLTGKPTLGTAASKDVGAANGVAGLDSGGTVPTSQLPAAVLGSVKYQGSWNASTNSPTLASGTGTQGYYYVVGTAGSTNLDGITDWKVGDWAIYNGTAWQKIDNTDAVTSVAGKTGAVTLTSSDISGFATVATTGAYNDLTGKPTLGTAAAQDTTYFATAAQGTKADSALQPAAIGVSVQAYDADLTAWAGVSTSAKQDTLVSGTNIKTVNSTSLLGSGDVTVQSTLVSGTNIKSVNSTSLLGSGDLALFAGGLIQVKVVATLPGTPDANTLYIVTT